MTQTDELVAAYLARVERAASRLPAGRREELIADLREHIEIARAESEAQTEAEVRTILDRLGDPESIVAAADTQTDLPRVPPAAPYPPASPYPPAGPYPPAVQPAPQPKRTALWVVLAVVAAFVLLAFCAGAFTLARDSGAPPSMVEEVVPAEPAPQPTLTVSTGP
jgi:uncharacterized membrane protein